MLFNFKRKKNFILHKRNAFSKEACVHVINYFEKRRDLHQIGTICDMKIDYSIKKCTEIFLKSKDHVIFHDLLFKSLDDYAKIYPSVDKLNKFSIHPHHKIQKYNPGEGFFGEHCENSGDEDTVLAWMIYLNDVTDGGYTEFPNQNIKFQPRRGDFLMCPAYITHTHFGIVSKTQTKYIATGWYSLLTVSG